MEIKALALLRDNYAWAIIKGREMAVLDPSESEPVLNFAQRHGYRLRYILNTHHHHDHVGGNLAIKAATGARIIGPAYDKERIPGIDLALKAGLFEGIFGERAEIFFIPGHTRGHIAFYFPGLQALFCGDTLFSIGCGRLFEGTPAQMWHSLCQLRALPDETKIYCGHEYTEANCRFAFSLDPENSALQGYAAEVANKRTANIPTIPSLMALEKIANPFLRADDPALAARLNLTGEEPERIFAEIRALKDRF